MPHSRDIKKNIFKFAISGYHLFHDYTRRDDIPGTGIGLETDGGQRTETEKEYVTGHVHRTGFGTD
jgi:hypothetical protein